MEVNQLWLLAICYGNVMASSESLGIPLNLNIWPQTLPQSVEAYRWVCNEATYKIFSLDINTNPNSRET